MSNEDSVQSISLTVLGRYRLQQRIGRGGMGEVWLAEDPRLHRQVAIKTLPFHTQGDSEFLQRFEREARAAAALNHPHILPVHDYGEQPLSEGQAITYIVMPYVEGGTLADHIKQLAAEHMSMPPDEALNYLAQAAEAIDYAHEQDVVHRDIKPSNMLLRKGQWILLADFGIARILSEQEHLTQSGVGVGTPEYMAPEQAQGEPEAASDNYSLAVIAYQLFTGKLPFHASTPYAITIQHITAPPPPPRQLNPDIPPAVEQVLLQGLAKDPAQRPTSARAFVAALKQAWSDRIAVLDVPTQLAQYEPLPLAVPQQLTSPLTPHGPGDSKLPVLPEQTGISRRQILIGGSAAALLVAGGLGTWAALSRSSSPTHKSGPVPKPTPDPNAPVMTLLAHTSPISSLAWSPASPGILASGAKDSLTLLWDIPAIQQGQASTTSPKARQQFGLTSPLLLGWSPDGKTLAIGNANAVIDSDPNLVDLQVDVYEGDLSRRIPQYDVQLMTYHQTAFLYALCWGPSKSLVTVSHPHQVTGTGEYMLEFRDPLQPQKGLMSIHQKDFAYALAAAPDGLTIAVGTGLGVMVGQPHGTGRTGQWEPTIPLLLFNNKAMIVGAVTWSPDGRYVAAINNAQFVGQSFAPESLIAFWDWQSGDRTSQALSLPDASTVLTTLTWCPAPSSGLLAAGSKDGSVYLWHVDPQHLQGNTLPIRRLSGLQAQVTALAWSMDGRWLAAGYNDDKNSILLWKM